MTRYAPLAAHLRASSPPFRMTFEEVAELVGGLPSSATKRRQWWENDRGHVQARAWMDEGWRVEGVDLTGRVVVFGHPAV